MSDTFGPFDPDYDVNGDPIPGTGVWSQDQWYRTAPAWAPSGVIATPAASSSSGSFGLTFNGLIASVAAGRAWVRGAGYELSGGAKSLAVNANTNASLSRRDRIVLRRDLAAKTVTMILLQGAPTSSPVAPALTQSETGQWDVPLFNFVVPPSSGTVITGVVDERLWVDPAGGGLAAVTAGVRRVPFSNISQLTPDAAIVTVPVFAQPVASRVVLVASGKTGFAGVDATVSWDYDTIPAAASNVIEDSTEAVSATSAHWAALTHTLSMDLPANTSAAPRLVLRASTAVYNRGGVTVHVSPVL